MVAEGVTGVVAAGAVTGSATAGTGSRARELSTGAEIVGLAATGVLIGAEAGDVDAEEETTGGVTVGTTTGPDGGAGAVMETTGGAEGAVVITAATNVGASAAMTRGTGDRLMAAGGGIAVSSASAAGVMAGAVCPEAPSRSAPQASSRRTARSNVASNRMPCLGAALRWKSVVQVGAKDVLITGLLSLTAS